jgi:hypothetical protein
MAYGKGVLSDYGKGRFEEMMSDIGILSEISKIFEEAMAEMRGYQPTGEAGVEKFYLRDLGLENFLCPPLKNGGTLAGNSMIYASFCSPGSSRVPNWMAKDFYENLRFMVFKVKQRGQKDYKRYRNRQIQKVLKKKYILPSPGSSGQNTIQGEEALENINYGEVYGTNWPYDYFSLLETIKIDVEFKVPS